MKKTFEGIVEYEQEDSGQALIATIDDANTTNPTPTMFVRLQSWDEEVRHVEARQFEGKRVRITVEII
jgi:hypothetical protein